MKEERGAPYTFVFFGRSGSGKGVQSQKLISYLNKNFTERKTLYIETGQLFRNFIKEDESYSQKRIGEVINGGGLLPAFLPVWMWADFLVRNFSGEENLVFDGVARRVEEAPILEEALRFYQRPKPFVVRINASPECVTERLLKRGRKDDTKERIKERLDWYEENVVPSIGFFEENKNVDFVNINGDQTPDEVYFEMMQKTIKRSQNDTT